MKQFEPFLKTVMTVSNPYCDEIRTNPGGVLGLQTYGDVPLENLKCYPVPEYNFLKQYPVL